MVSLQHENEKKLSILPIFFVVFLDLLGVGIAIPVLAPLLINPEYGMLPPDAALQTRTLMLGVLIALYPLAQFFGAPLLGGLSDHYGRKKLLVVSLAGTFIGYVLFAIGITTHNIMLLFAGRIIDGFTGGNISIAMSAIADLSDQKEKTKNFGLVGMAFGLGFIIGPYFGGKLADSTLVSWFNFSTPFWFAAILCLINILLMLRLFTETLRTPTKTPISPLMGFRNIARAFQLSNLRTLFTVSFFMVFGFNFFTQFFSVFLIEKFNFTQSMIGDLFAFQGFWIALTQGVIMRPIIKRFNPDQILKFSLLFLAITMPLLLVPSQTWQLYLLLPFVAIFAGLNFPNLSATISNLGRKDSQGEILGINQSIQSLAMAFPPLIAGFVAAIDTSFPVILSGFFILLSWAILVLFFKPEKKEIFHEA